MNVVKLRVDESAQRGDSLAAAEELDGSLPENAKVGSDYLILLCICDLPK